MERSPGWAAWLVARRAEIERSLAGRLGARPDPGAPETEALRRFRSFATASLRGGGASAQPSLDGLRADGQRVSALIEAWSRVASELAGERAGEVRALLDPLVGRFLSAVLGAAAARRARGAGRATRRAVVAAIDRIADAFLAVDVDSGQIVDANPAAGALLGVDRKALLGTEAVRFLAPDTREPWQSHLEGLAEAAEPRRFRAALLAPGARPVPVEAIATRHATRERTLALVVARPAPNDRIR